MQPAVPSSALRTILRQEVRQDSSATLRTTKLHLEALADSAPGDSVARLHAWLSEMDELIQQYDLQYPLRDLLNEPTP